jgi:MFS family permease
MILGAILQASSYGIAQIIVARVVLGVGMGFVSSALRSCPYMWEHLLTETQRSTRLYRY